MMLKFEMKKIFLKPRNKIALLVFMIILLVVCILTIHMVSYTDQNGNDTIGITAAKNLKREKNKWAGYLTEDVFRNVYQERRKIHLEKKADSVQEENKAYHKSQSMEGIADLINNANSSWHEYNYFAIENITEEDAAAVYQKRISNLREYLNSGEEHFSKKEKEFLIDRYQELPTPFYYEYCDGWSALLDNLPTFLMLLVLFAGLFISGIFSDEFQTKADAIFFSTKFGRNKAIWAKIGAGILVSTGLYLVSVILYTAIVLGILGADGASCPIQFQFWRSCYNISIFQGYLLIVTGGYIGMLFALAIGMMISILSRSTVAAAIVPFVIICFFPFLSRIIPLPQICSFFPHMLLFVYNQLHDFELAEIGGKVTMVSTIIMPLYFVLSILLIPFIYLFYKKAEIK